MFPSLAQLVWLSLLQGGLFLQAFRGPLANQHFTDNITCLEYYIAALLINLFGVVTKIIIFDRWQNWPLATEHMLFFSGIRWMHAHKELQMQCEPWFQVYQKSNGGHRSWRVKGKSREDMKRGGKKEGGCRAVTFHSWAWLPLLWEPSLWLAGVQLTLTLLERVTLQSLAIVHYWIGQSPLVCLVHWNLPFAAACYVLGHVNMFWLVMYCCIDMVCWHGHNF